MILMIDNYDSFTWNVVQYLWELGAEVDVQRNDAISLCPNCRSRSAWQGKLKHLGLQAGRRGTPWGVMPPASPTEKPGPYCGGMSMTCV